MIITETEIFRTVGEVQFTGFTYLTPLIFPHLKKIVYIFTIKKTEVSDAKILSIFSQSILKFWFRKFFFKFFFVYHIFQYSESIKHRKKITFGIFM